MTDTETKRMSREELIKRLNKYHFQAANSDASFNVLIEPLLNYNVTLEEARRICTILRWAKNFSAKRTATQLRRVDRTALQT
jgi:hypothetical protein